MVSPEKTCMTSSRLDYLRRATPAVLPSLLMCDFGNLEAELDRLVAAGVKGLHLDVMDGHFVPNLTYGMPIVAGLRRLTELPLDVHLMISDPLRYAAPMVDAGADLLTFHVEAVRDPAETAQRIKACGVGVGITLNPDTPLEAIEPALDVVDLVLVMSVNAGFGGQQFNPVALDRLRTLRRDHPDLILEIDGGMDTETIGPAAAAGCDLFVVGSAIFQRDDYAPAIDELTAALQNARDTSANGVAGR